MTHDDILWKALLEDLFDDFLRFFIPNADTAFNLDKGFEYLDKELEQLFPPDDNSFAPRYVDKLVKVHTNDHLEQLILIHVEVQGYTDKTFAKRMFQYYTRISDKYNKPIVAFAIYVDSNKKFHPKQFTQKHYGTEVTYKFNTLKVIDQDEDKLEASNNPFALAILTAKLAISSKKIKDQQLFDLARDLAKRLLVKQIPKRKIRNLMNFLRYYLRFEKQEMFDKFVKEIEILTEKRTTMGIEEFLLDRAEKKGMSKKELAVTLNLLKSTDFSTLQIAQLVGVSEDFVLKVKNGVVK